MEVRKKKNTVIAEDPILIDEVEAAQEIIMQVDSLSALGSEVK